MRSSVAGSRRGATVDALRSAAYFPQHQHAQSLPVLAAWVLAGALALLVASRVLGRGPAGG
jgi:hypothetical protein